MLNHLILTISEHSNWIPANALYLAKTYLRLQNREEAKKYCERTLQFTLDDPHTKLVSQMQSYDKLLPRSRTRQRRL